MTTLSWIGTGPLIARLAKAAAAAPSGLGIALYAEAHSIMAASVRITPIDTGSLRASGHVDTPKVTPSEASVTLGYGGAAAPYAIYVHEDPNARHSPPTQYKFLELPILEASRGFAERLGLKLKLTL